MTKLIVIAALMAGLCSPAVAAPAAAASSNAVNTGAPASLSSEQSVYRTERTILIRNYDGTASETTIITVYYVFGYE
jgi:hypothetical protein